MWALSSTSSLPARRSGCQLWPEAVPLAIGIDDLYARLMTQATGMGNDGAFAAMIATRSTGGGALPPWLGLERLTCLRLLDYHFPGLGTRTLPLVLKGLAARGPGWRPGPDRRQAERQDLIDLMLAHRAGGSPSEIWMAAVVAAGCMGGDHLWEDLGLSRRPELTELMRRNFPALAARNVRDMKWKRFLYKQLCEAEGIHACRALSCEVCADYHVCFSPDH